MDLGRADNKTQMVGILEVSANKKMLITFNEDAGPRSLLFG